MWGDWWNVILLGLRLRRLGRVRRSFVVALAPLCLLDREFRRIVCEDAICPINSVLPASTGGIRLPPLFVHDVRLLIIALGPSARKPPPYENQPSTDYCRKGGDGYNDGIVHHVV